MAPKPMNQRPTPEEAARGIYIDFEGFAPTRAGVIRPPTFIGVLCEEHSKQYVFDERLRSAAEAKGIEMRVLEDVVAEILEKAEREDRFVFAYSTRELEASRDHTELGDRMGKRYRNGLKIARRWLEKCHPEEVIRDRKGKKRWNNDPYRTKDAKEWSLINFLKFIGHPPPPHLGIGKTTSRMKAVIDMLAKKDNDYSTLTRTVKAKWTKVLEHNRQDCIGLRRLMLRVSSGC